MKLDDQALEILAHLDHEEVNPHDLYRSNGFDFSRATFYRRLEELKQLGLVEWMVGKAKLTEKGLKLRSLFFDNFYQTLDEVRDKGLVKDSYLTDDRDNTKELGKKEEEKKGGKEKEEREKPFRIYESDELKEEINDTFVYVDYPTASYILKALMLVAGVDEKGLKTNVEKFRALKETDFRVKLAVNHFENSSKQVLVFLDELMKLGKISALYCGVKNERKALKNKKLVEFWQDWNFENERFKLPKESVTLFPLFLIGVIGVILVVALRSGYEHTSILSVLIVLYFFRSMLFKEMREL